MKNTFPIIETVSDFRHYVDACTDGQLIGLCIEADAAIRTGDFDHGFLRNVWITVASDPEKSGIKNQRELGYIVASELMRRVVNGTFDISEYIIHRSGIALELSYISFKHK